MKWRTKFDVGLEKFSGVAAKLGVMAVAVSQAKAAAAWDNAEDRQMMMRDYAYIMTSSSDVDHASDLLLWYRQNFPAVADSWEDLLDSQVRGYHGKRGRKGLRIVL